MKHDSTRSNSTIAPGRSRAFYRLRRAAYRRQTISSAAVPPAEFDPAKDTIHEKLRDALLRAKADLDNYRKRAERDRVEANKRAGEDVVVALLPILDNFSRAIDAAKDSADVKAVMEGVAMIHEQFQSSLASRGLRRVEAMDQDFDPAFHEAVSVDHRDDLEENKVTLVMQDGFLFNGRLLRPAMVRVSKKPPASDPAPSENEEQ